MVVLRRSLVRFATLLAPALTTAVGCSSKSPSNPGTTDAGAHDSGMQAAAVPVPQPDCNADSTDWPMWGHNVCNTNSAAGSGGGITKDNVGKLTTKWVYNAAGDVSATPAVVGGSVYFPDWGHMINRLDSATGNVIWSKSVEDLMKEAGDAGSALPDFYSRNTPIVTGSTVIFGTLRIVGQITSPGPSAFLVAIDKETAAVRWVTPLHEGHPAAVITGSPVLDGNRLYVGVASQEEYSQLAPGYTCCTFRGSVVAVDVATGNIVWRTHTIRDDVYYGDAGAGDGGTSDGGALPAYAGNAIWSSTPAVDRKRKQLYVTTGNNYRVPPGAPAAVDGNYVDAVVALDLDTGTVKWARSLPEGGSDLWTLNSPSGPDSDFGAGANLFTAIVNGATKDLVGAGQKSGTYWALDADTGDTVWSTTVGPGGHLGGIHWGTATDGARIYVGVNNGSGMPFPLAGNGPMTTSGAWAALDTATGHFVWQVANPTLPMPYKGTTVNGPVAVVDGVMFGGSMDAQGTMFALDATTGDVLWSFQSGGTVYGGPAIAGGVVYWGSGYYTARSQYLMIGTPSKKLYAFEVGP